MNFHFFVLLSTIAFYILLKLYKSSITYKNKNLPHTPKKNSNLFYILFIPIILYLTRYIYFPLTSSPAPISSPVVPITSSIPAIPVDPIVQSNNFLNSPYPASTSYSSSGSY